MESHPFSQSESHNACTLCAVFGLCLYVLLLKIHVYLFIDSICPFISGLGIISIFADVVFVSGVIHFSLSLALNVILTTSIILRLWYCRAQSQTTFGKGYGRHFTFILILFVESAFPIVLCSTVLLIASAKITQWFLESRHYQSYQVPYRDTDFASWDAIFQVMLAITPHIQASYTLITSRW